MGRRRVIRNYSGLKIRILEVLQSNNPVIR